MLHTFFCFSLFVAFMFARVVGWSVTKNVTAPPPPAHNWSNALVRRPEGRLSHPVLLWTIEELLNVDEGLPMQPAERILEKSFVVNVRHSISYITYISFY